MTIRMENHWRDRPPSMPPLFSENSPMAISATVRQKIWATTCRVLSPFVPVLYGKGYGHAHTEKESGEDGVGESHHVFVHPGMHQPVGTFFSPGMSLTKSMKNMVSARNTSTAAIRWGVKLFMIDNLFGV